MQRRWEPLRTVGPGRRKPRPALRTIGDLADEMGVNRFTLGKLMHADPVGPRPVIDGNKSSNALRTTWYNPAEARRWWAERNKTCPES